MMASMSGFSQIEICNGALAYCGEASITSINQEVKSARILKRNYDLVRKRLLSRYRWNFAKERVILAADPTPPVSGFTHKYRVPSDMINLIGIFDQAQDQANYTATDIVYKREGQFILCDNEPLSIVYIKDVDNPAEFDPAFVAVLELFLATKIFYDITKGLDRYNSLVGEREKALKEARLAHAFENTPEIIMASDWVDSRDRTWSPMRAGPIS